MPKYFLTFTLAASLAITCFAGNITSSKTTGPDLLSAAKPFCFTENKGQVYDQNNQLRPDVLFGGESNGLVFHLRKNGISYQLSRIDKWKTEKLNSKTNKKAKPNGIEQSTVYRIDINWLNTNTHPTILKHQELEGYANFYNSDKQITVKSYGEVMYQSLYKGIDLKWYEKNGELKYDYLCAAGADYKKINLQIEGAEQLRLNTKGELEIKTPLGTIIEKAPVVLQAGKQLVSKWVLTNNVLSFDIENLNKLLPYVIDPAVRVWGTYYGGNSFDYSNACATYTNGDVYLVGSTYLNTSTIIATSGSYQSTLGGFDDAFLVKFNSSGARVWSTYYGGSNSDNGRSCVVDGSGNVYICGITSSTNGIATLGTYQSTFGGGNTPDAFLVKFNSAGARVWGTYYGGNSVDEAHQCALDPSGDIYMSGTTELTTSTVIASTGGVHQNAFGGGFNDAFLVRFSSNGLRVWGTYYGGSGIDFGSSCIADANFVYMAGTTSSTNNIASGGSQNTFGGNLYDAYLVKFNTSNGARVWGTFYGGNALDQAFGCALDGSGNVYMCGATSTSVTNVIATAASHQSVGATAGDDDGFLVKFNGLGVRQWGTYYGGDSYDVAYECSIDASNNVYLVGTTTATLSGAIATAASHQTVLGNNFGGTNAYIAKFNTSGIRQWGTFYGEDGDDGNNCTIDMSGAIYMCGAASTTNTSFISTTGSHQANHGGILDGYLVKFLDCNAAAPISATSASNQAICAGNTTTLSATGGTATINWYTTAIGGTSIGTGTNYITPQPLASGTYTYYAEGGSCGGTPARTAITVTVSSTPTITANGGSICAGQSFTVLPSGANSYTVYDGGSNPLAGLVLSPPLTPSVYPYYVFGTSANGCPSGFGGVAIINLTVNPSPTVVVSNGTICAGQSFVIQPNGATSFTIQGGTATVSPISTTNYTITGSDNGCVSTNATTCTVMVEATPTISVNSGSLCRGSSFTIQATGANTYTYQGGSNIVSPNSNSTYTVIGKSPAGCLAQNVATCNITVLSTPTITASNGSVCLGKSFTIVPAGAVTYSLLDGSGNAYTTNMVVSPLTTTNYIVGGTGANGCSAFSSGLSVVNVTVTSLPLSISSGTICRGNTFTLNPNGAVSYTYTGGSAIVSPSTTSNYTVTGSDATGCLATGIATVFVEPTPVISVNSGTICPGSSFTIVPSGGTSYTIQGGNAVVSPTTTTSYTVSGKSASGCDATNNATCRVTVNLPPRSPFPSTVTAPYVGAEYFVLKNEYNYTFEPKTEFVTIATWHKDELVLVATADKMTVSSTHSITITYKSTGCSATYTLLVNPPEDPSKNWVFPTLITPNSDGKNDWWMPTYKNYASSVYIQEFVEGLRSIKEIKIVNLFKQDQIFYKYDNESNGGFIQSLLAWAPSQSDINGVTYCVVVVTYTNGKISKGFLTVDPSSPKK